MVRPAGSFGTMDDQGDSAIQWRAQTWRPRMLFHEVSHHELVDTHHVHAYGPNQSFSPSVNLKSTLEGKKDHKTEKLFGNSTNG